MERGINVNRYHIGAYRVVYTVAYHYWSGVRGDRGI